MLLSIQSISSNFGCETFICKIPTFSPKTAFLTCKCCSIYKFKTCILTGTIRFVLKSTPRKLKK